MLKKNYLPILLMALPYVPGTVFANRVNDPDVPLTHCYHWLNERTNKYLAYKYDYAKSNGGELTFFTTAATSNGSVAGPGLYCAKTPIGSIGYGDRIIRVDFVDDVVIQTTGGTKVCGTKGNYYSNPSECQQKPVDVHHYDSNSDWYVIKNPQAVKSWSANSDQLIADLNVSKGEGPSSAAHIDLTLQAMQAETAVMGKRIVFNNQARMSLDRILNDPQQIAKIPILSLIDMVASYSGDKISESRKKQLFDTHFDRALKDKVLSFDDFTNTLKNHRHLNAILAARIEKVNYQDLNDYNAATLIAAIESLNIKVSDGQAVKLWQQALISASSLEALAGMNLKKDGIFVQNFEASLPPAQQVGKNLPDSNIAAFLKLMNEFSGKRGQLKTYTEILFDKMLKSARSQNFVAIYDSITNPSLAKEQALADLLIRAQANNFTGFDPIGAGLLYEKSKSGFSDAQQKEMERDIVSLPLKVDQKLSFQYLEDFKAGRLVLPSFYSAEIFLNHLVDRSIRERSLGKNTTNTFRMILNGYYHYFAKTISDARDSGRSVAAKAASDYFLQLSELLLRKNQMSYAYIALQNGLHFGKQAPIDVHPVEVALDWQGQKGGNFDQTMEMAIRTSLDPSVLEFLLAREANGHGAEVMKARRLVDSIMDYLASVELKQRFKNADFIAAQAERKVWANVIVGKNTSNNGRVYSDICAFYKGYERLSDALYQNHSRSNRNAIEALKVLAEGDFCKKDNQ